MQAKYTGYLIVSGILAAGWFCGCRRQPANPTPPAAAPARPSGRLVPAVVAGFERGLGGWHVESSNGTAASAPAATIEKGDASRGERWLAIPVTSVQGKDVRVDLHGNVPAGDWTRFGDTVRADVRIVPGGAKATAQLYVVSSDGKETVGPEEEVTSAWKTLAWNADASLGNVSRIGLRWRVSGNWNGRLGIDNIRVGAADALSVAYSVVTGPFPTRERATQAMKTLAATSVKSFPIYEEGWYLNLGTFSTRTAAEREARRLGQQGVKCTVLLR